MSDIKQIHDLMAQCAAAMNDGADVTVEVPARELLLILAMAGAGYSLLPVYPASELIMPVADSPSYTSETDSED